MKALTYYNADYKLLGDLSSEINRKYCSKYGINFIIENDENLSEGRPAAWAKINAIKKQVSFSGEWILWIDCDAIFTNFDKNIFDLVDDNFNFIFSTDGYYAKEWHCWPSTGIFFIKDDEKSMEFLNKIWDQPKEVINHCWWENFALLKTINENVNLRTSYKVLEYKSIFSQIENWEKKDMMMHIAGGLKGENIKYGVMKNFIKNENI